MDEAEELLRLRDQVRRLLADGLAAEERHRHELAQRNHNHTADTDRHDASHVAETARRDDLHLGEMERRDKLHQAEILRRDDIHEHELELLRVALESRDTIGQAKGVIMATMRCSADEAYALIRKQSQHENRKLADVAIDIVHHASRRPAPPT